MKSIILAGGLPSTIIEENEKVPKPMAEIGGRPLLWHIMKHYSYYGYRDFMICTGYKGAVIKDYFMNFYIYQSDITVDLQTNEIKVHRKQTEDWRVSILDTGQNSSIMERLCMTRSYLEQEPVLVAYGDCLSDIDLSAMVHSHRNAGQVATLAVSYPTGRNEILDMEPNGTSLGRKTGAKPEAWVNACNMILEPRAFEYLEENIRAPYASSLIDCLAQKEEVHTYRHVGFWSPVETRRDKTWLEDLWHRGQAPWKIWDD